MNYISDSHHSDVTQCVWYMSYKCVKYASSHTLIFLCTHTHLRASLTSLQISLAVSHACHTNECVKYASSHTPIFLCTHTYSRASLTCPSMCQNMSYEWVKYVSSHVRIYFYASWETHMCNTRLNMCHARFNIVETDILPFITLRHLLSYLHISLDTSFLKRHNFLCVIRDSYAQHET